MDAQDIIRKYGLDKHSYTSKGAHGILNFVFGVGDCMPNNVKDYFGDTYVFTLLFIRQDYFHWYWLDSELDRIREKFIAKVNADPSYLDRLLSDWEARLRVFDTQIDRAEHTNLTTLSTEQFLDLFEAFLKAYRDEFSIAIGFQDAFSMRAEKFLEPLFRRLVAEKGKSEQFLDYYAVLLSPTRESFLQRERKDLLGIMVQAEKHPELLSALDSGNVEGVIRNYPTIWTELERHAREYFWMHNNYAKTPVLDAEHFLQELISLRKEGVRDAQGEIDKLDNQSSETLARKREIISELQLAQEHLNLVHIAEAFAYMQDERKKYVMISNHYQRLFADEVGRRLGLSQQEMDYVIYPEVREMLQTGKVDRERLKHRYMCSLVFHNVKGYEVFDGDVAESVYKQIFEPLQTPTLSELRGTVASTGKAEGIVKIVLKTHDLANVADGDILVSTMTRPEMVVAMKRAAAIVTDEGGITSHAAVVSRELGIPCIIGTKNATKSLKTGDFVEVDAEKGIVRIIKRGA